MANPWATFGFIAHMQFATATAEACPHCVEEAAEVERKLRNMLSGGRWT